MCAKFPRYSFEELLDKTPAALQYLTLQAVNLDMDMAKKLGMVLGGGDSKPAKKPANRYEENEALKGAGFKVRRE